MYLCAHETAHNKNKERTSILVRVKVRAYTSEVLYAKYFELLYFVHYILRVLRSHLQQSHCFTIRRVIYARRCAVCVLRHL